MAFIKGWASAAALLALAILASSCGSCHGAGALNVADLPSPYQALTGCYPYGENSGQVCFWDRIDRYGGEETVQLSFTSEVTEQATISGNNGYKIELQDSSTYVAARLELVCSTVTEVTSYQPQSEDGPAVIAMTINCPPPPSPPPRRLWVSMPPPLTPPPRPPPSRPTLVFKSYAQLIFPKAGEITKLAAGIAHGRALISVESVKALFAETVISNLASQFPDFASWFLTGAGAVNTSRITYLDFSYAVNSIAVAYTIDLPETGFAVGSAGFTAIDSALRSPAVFTGSLTNALGPVTVKYVAYVCPVSAASCEIRSTKWTADDDVVSIGVGVGVGVGLALLAAIGFAVKYWYYDAQTKDKVSVMDGGVAA